MSPTDWTNLLAAAKDVGIIAACLIILLIILFFVVRSITSGSKQNGELLNRLVDILGNSSERLSTLQQVVVQGHAQIDALTKTLAETSAAKQSTIEHNAKATETLQEIVRANTQALIELRTDYLVRWDAAVKKMTGAQDRIVTDVNANTDKRAGEIGGQHADQTEVIKKQMEDLKAHVDSAVLENGNATRAALEKQLKPILERLDQMQVDAEKRDHTMAQQIHEISNDLSKVVLLVTAPKDAEVHLATDAGETAPIDKPKEESKKC